MRAALSVHDNELLAYSVFAEPPRIVLHTAFRDIEPAEFTDIVFEGVVAYHFERDTFGTILFDVEETDLGGLLAQNVARFEDGASYGWPAGWVLTESMTVRATPDAPASYASAASPASL